MSATTWTSTNATGTDRWLAADLGAAWERALVVGVHREMTVTTLRLRLDGTPAVLPGQYYLVRLAIDAPPGIVEQAYSLSSSPFPPSPEIEIAVRDVEGGRASPLLARLVEVGDHIEVRGPFGFLTWTERDGGPVGLVGGGSGVAPLVSIVRYAAARGIETPMTMLCSSRDHSTMFLSEPLDELARRHSWLTVVHTFTRSPAETTARYHRRIDVDMLHEVMKDPAPRHFYVAGPADMVLAVRADLGRLGVSDDRIYSEDHA